MFADVQLPIRAAIPVELGAVTVLFRSNPRQPIDVRATAAHAPSDRICFIGSSLYQVIGSVWSDP